MPTHSIREHSKPALRCVFGLIISILGAGCVSTEKTVEAPKEVPQVTHFVLDPAPTIHAQAPLPDVTPFYVKVYSEQQLLERRLAYKAWDFNKDGKPDMLEYFDDHGEVIRRAYDFNGDGKVDREEP